MRYMGTHSLCAFFAHPDDESFSSAGALAMYVDAGVHVTLVTATCGEAGELVTGIDIGEEDLATWRERELHQAADILGVTDLRLLGFPDGRLDAHEDDLYASYAAILRELRPQVVITEDIQGITGHPDHLAVTRAVVRAFDSVPDGPLKLYEHVVPISLIGPDAPIQGTQDDYITTRLDVSRWRDRMRRALAAHKSQVPPALIDRVVGMSDPWIDHYVCVRSRVPMLIPEYDLFAGIHVA